MLGSSDCSADHRPDAGRPAASQSSDVSAQRSSPILFGHRAVDGAVGRAPGNPAGATRTRQAPDPPAVDPPTLGEVHDSNGIDHPAPGRCDRFRGGKLFAAKRLARESVDVTLITRTPYHLFQPLLYQVTTGILSEGEIGEDAASRRRWMSFVVVGGGPTGVEMAGQLIELPRRRSGARSAGNRAAPVFTTATRGCWRRSADSTPWQSWDPCGCPDRWPGSCGSRCTCSTWWGSRTA